VPSIIVDQGEIIDLAVGHLRSLGHTDIGVLIGPSSYWSSSERSRRLDAMEHANGDATSIVRIDSFEPTFDGGKASLGTVLDAGLTAIATFNDVMALGLIAAASEHGVDVPDDLSIVGSDGVPLSAMSTPALTTVAAPVQELGAGAIEILDHTMEAPMSKRLTQRTTRPHLEVRSSTSSPRAPTR
jgi:DNA-binding LacI/PurR family transcriptional regulator